MHQPTDLCEGFGLNNPQHMEDTDESFGVLTDCNPGFTCGLL